MTNNPNDSPVGTRANDPLENISGNAGAEKRRINTGEKTSGTEIPNDIRSRKKSFKKYLLEGLMIFVAVSMGFIAENIREKFAERETEIRNIELIIENLKEDTLNLEKVYQFTHIKRGIVDDLIRNKIEGLGGVFLIYNLQRNFKTINAELKPGVLNRFFNYYHYAYVNLSTIYSPQLKKQKESAKNLIQFLQTEYHLGK